MAKLHTKIESYLNKAKGKKIYEADFFKDSKSGKFAEIETGLETETIPVEVSYEIPNDILSEIIDKLKADPSNTMDFDSMSKDVIAKKIADAILFKFMKADNIELSDLQGDNEEDTDISGVEPEVSDIKESFDIDDEKVMSYGEFSSDEYKEEDTLNSEIEKLKNDFDGTEEEIEEFKAAFLKGEVSSAEEFATNFFDTDDDLEDFDNDDENDLEETKEDVMSFESFISKKKK